MAGPLGCETDYSVVLHRAGGASPIARLAPLQSTEWNRRLSEVSTGRAVIAKAAATADCCAALALASPYACELSVYRGPSLVWQGPVNKVVESRTVFTIEARDVIDWFNVRTMRYTYQWTSLPYAFNILGTTGEPVRIAEQYIRDVFQAGRNDPYGNGDALHGKDVNLATYMEFHYGTAAVEHSAYQDVDLLADRFNDLADDSLDYTTVGRRIVVSYPDWLYKTGAITRLTEDDFAADTDLTIEGDGLATRYVAYPSDYDRSPMMRDENTADLIHVPYQPSGVAAYPGHAAGDIYGDSPYYGRVERVAEIDTASKRQSTFDNRAAALVKRHYPPPGVLRVGDNAALSPYARVGVPDLVCGSRIDVVLSQDVWCRPIAASFTLTGVTGTWDEGGERIGVSLEASNEGVVST